jgi:hypothetical protein
MSWYPYASRRAVADHFIGLGGYEGTVIYEPSYIYILLRAAGQGMDRWKVPSAYVPRNRAPVALTRKKMLWLCHSAYKAADKQEQLFADDDWERNQLRGDGKLGERQAKFEVRERLRVKGGMFEEYNEKEREQDAIDFANSTGPFKKGVSRMTFYRVKKILRAGNKEGAWYIKQQMIEANRKSARDLRAQLKAKQEARNARV